MRRGRRLDRIISTAKTSIDLSQQVYHTSETNDGRAAGEDAQNADIVLGHSILDGREEETTETTNYTSLCSVVKDIVRLEIGGRLLVKRHIRARWGVLHGDCDAKREELGAFMSWA